MSLLLITNPKHPLKTFAVADANGSNLHSESIIDPADIDPQRHTYYCLAHFEENSTRRSSSTAVSRSSFVVDMDLGGISKPLVDILKRVAKACADQGIHTPTSMVSSGGGLHVYWVLDKAIDMASWRARNEAFKAVVKPMLEPLVAEGFAEKFDWCVTTNPVTLVRVPNSLNYKYDPPRRVKEIYCGKPLPIDAFDKYFPPVAHETPQPSSSSSASTHTYAAQSVFDGCATMQAMLDAGGAGYPEPAWRAGLKTVARCVDGEDYIHKLSNKHKDYDFDATVAKYETIMSYDTPQLLCSTIDEACGSLSKCDKCPLKNMGRSPFALADPLHKKVVTTEAPSLAPFEVNEQGETGNKFTLAVDDAGNKDEMFIPLRRGWALDAMRLFRATEPDSEGNVSEYVEYSFRDLSDNSCYTATLDCKLMLLTPDGKRYVFQAIQNQAFISIGELGNRGDYKGFNALANLINSTNSWRERIKRRDPAAINPVPSRNGLSRVNVGGKETRVYTVGSDVFTETGDLLKTPAQFVDPTVQAMLGTRGTLEGWKENMAKITPTLTDPQIVALASSFAAPLAPLSCEDPATMWFSGYTGDGKTFSLKLAASIWGANNLVMGLNMTPAAMDILMGQLKCVPMLVDEVKPANTAQSTELVNRVFAMVNGQSKVKATQGGGGVIDFGSWKSVTMMTSNYKADLLLTQQRFRGHKQTIFNNHLADSAAVARVLEIPSKPVGSAAIDPAMFKAKDAVTNEHYGHAGRAFAKYVMSNMDALKDELGEAYAAFMSAPFSKKISNGSTRFFCSLLSLVWVAGRHAIEEGLLPITKEQLNSAIKYMVSCADTRTETAMEMEAEIKEEAVTGAQLRRDLLAFKNLNKVNVGTLEAQHLPTKGVTLNKLRQTQLHATRDGALDWIETECYVYIRVSTLTSLAPTDLGVGDLTSRRLKRTLEMHAPGAKVEGQGVDLLSKRVDNGYAADAIVRPNPKDPTKPNLKAARYVVIPVAFFEESVGDDDDSDGGDGSGD